MNNRYNIEEIKEKLERCKNMKLEDVTLDEVDEISAIKSIEENLARKGSWIF